ncbi:MAG: A/G-specific adenine glycosylase [Flavobacteriales bacterium]
MSDLFSSVIISWYNQNKRDLPWRKESDPFKIWLSEIILQQTQVVQGLSYYVKFTEAFQNVHELADASEEEVLKLWQGLGYYSRARNLHFTAKYISQELNGVFPDTYSDIIRLKGVGHYTASAIASFVYGEKVAVLDGNVYRVLSRVYGVTDAINTTSGEKLFRELALDLLPEHNVDSYNQGIMEFGALQCVPKSPKCEVCPLLNHCNAYKNDIVSKLPVKLKKTKVKPLYIHFFILRRKGKVWLRKRVGQGIWQNLWEFPNISSDQEMKVAEAIESWISVSGMRNITITKSISADKHLLSHKRIFSFFHMIEGAGEIPEELGVPVSIEDYESYPVHRLMSKFIDQNEDILRD